MADSTPPIPKPLIEWLERVYPNDQTNLIGCTDQELWRCVGSQEVVKRLRTVYNQQNKTGEPA